MYGVQHSLVNIVIRGLILHSDSKVAQPELILDSLKTFLARFYGITASDSTVAAVSFQ